MTVTKISRQNQRPLARYLAEPEKIEQPWKLNQKTRQPGSGLSIEHYTLASQHWPKGKELLPTTTLWEHQLTLYRPEVLKTSQALLFVNGGTRHHHPQQDNPLPHELNFTRLALETHSLIVDLQDVPNQYLTFDDAIPRKGDCLYAYSWNRYMDDTINNAYWPLSLPMTKAVIKAMDAVQQIMLQEYFFPIEHFLVCGLSKRGLATWLAAIHDERINAIVPVVIDTLNTQKVMQQILSSFNNVWPPAFYEFIAEKIPERLDSKEFEQLMEIEDPLAYLNGHDNHFFKERLSIPKYIISASGDDFFTPDCLSIFLDQLPGETTVRFVPNQGHLIDLKIVEDALLAYYQRIIKQVPLPIVKWGVNQLGNLCQVITDKRPKTVTLWEAENPVARDFRLAAKITYVGKNISGLEREGLYQYPLQVGFPEKGWKAYFVELCFQQEQGGEIIITTPAFVTPARAK